MRRLRTLPVLVLALGLAGPGYGQSGQQATDAQQRLQGVRSELRAVAAQRRQLEGRRGEASRLLRSADEAVSASQSALEQTRSELAQTNQRLVQLQSERARYSGDMASRRADAKPLKALLAQDRVADAERALILQGYLQRAQVERIRTLSAEIMRIQALETEMVEQRTALDRARVAQAAQVSQSQDARKDRAKVMEALDRQYRDRAARERALGQDARALQTLLAQLRAAAAKAAREEARARAQREAPPAQRATAPRPVDRARVATAPAPRVGGMGWPVAGGLLAGFGGRMPDGRRSDGVLIAAAAGTRVQAVADGTVVFADWMTGYGMILIIDHGNGYMSLYAHNDGLLRQAGDAVHKGDAVATVGSSGGQAMPALYFELRRDGKPVNPSAWLSRQ